VLIALVEYLLAYLSCVGSVICDKKVCDWQLIQETHSTDATDTADASDITAKT